MFEKLYQPNLAGCMKYIVLYQPNLAGCFNMDSPCQVWNLSWFGPNEITEIHNIV